MIPAVAAKKAKRHGGTGQVAAAAQQGGLDKRNGAPPLVPGEPA